MSGSPTACTAEYRLVESAERTTHDEIVASLHTAGCDTTAGNNPSGYSNEDAVAIEAWSEPNSTRVVRLNAEKQLKVVTMSIRNPTAYPHRAFGKVFVYSVTGGKLTLLGEYCAVLVGRNVILTTSKAMPWDYESFAMRFVPAYNRGQEPFGHSYVQNFLSHYSVNKVSGYDYAVCKLYDPLGDTVGYLGTYAPGNDNEYYNHPWYFTGYPIVGDTMALYFLSIVDVDNDGADNDGATQKELESYPMGLGGHPGTILWGRPKDLPKYDMVIGVLSGDEKDFLQPTYTVAAGGKALVNYVRRGQQDWWLE